MCYVTTSKDLFISGKMCRQISGASVDNSQKSLDNIDKKYIIGSSKELQYIHTAWERDQNRYRGQMESMVSCRNAHTDPRQKQGPGPIVFHKLDKIDNNTNIDMKDFTT